MCEHYKYMLQIKPEFDIKFKTTGIRTQMVYLCEVEDVKRGIFKLNYDKTHFNLLVKECGKCHICRYKKASIKACQAQCEAKSYKNKCSFITLTFGTDNLKKYIHKDKRYNHLSRYQKDKYIKYLQWTLEKREFQLFMKRLRYSYLEKEKIAFCRKNGLYHLLLKRNGDKRKRISLPKCYDFKPTKIRFLHSAEYGCAKSRPHHHAVVYGINFNFDRTELRYSWKQKKKVPVHFNNFLSNLWKFGDVTTDNVTYQACNYVARYITKKTVNKSQEMELQDVAGSYYAGRIAEYCTQSNRNGLGYDYYLKNAHKINKDRHLYFQNQKGEWKSVSLPRYFKELMRRHFKQDYLKMRRDSFFKQEEFSKKSVDELMSRMSKDRNKVFKTYNSFCGNLDYGISNHKLHYLLTELKKQIFDDCKNYRDLFTKTAFDTGFIEKENIRLCCYKNYEKYRKFLYRIAFNEYVSDKFKLKSDSMLSFSKKKLAIDLLENPFKRENLDIYSGTNDIFEKWKDYEVCYDKN